MRPTGLVLQILSVLAALMGLLWIGQGLGLVHWPASSFMLDQRPWAFYGLLLVIVALCIGLVGRRLSSARQR